MNLDLWVNYPFKHKDHTTLKPAIWMGFTAESGRSLEMTELFTLL